MQQLFVAPGARRRGVATVLVEKLVGLGREWNRFQIQAKVASELEANRFWEANGFKIGCQKPARTKGRYINYRFRQLPQALFPPPEERELEYRRPLLNSVRYVLDVNIVIDQLRREKFSGSSSEVLRAALAGEYKLFTTPEFHAEIARNSPEFGSDPLFQFASNIPMLKEIDPRKCESIVAEIGPMIFPGIRPEHRKYQRSMADLKHLAYCVYYQVSGFITRDQALLGRAVVFMEKFSVDILAPWEIASPSLADRALPFNANFGANGRLARIVDIAKVKNETISEFFERNGLGSDRYSHYLVPGRDCKSTVFIAERGEIVGLGIWTHQDLVVNAVVCVAHEYEDHERVSDGILESIIRDGRPLWPRTIVLDIPLWQTSLRDAAIIKGFRQPARRDGDEAVLVKICVNGIVDEFNWGRLAKKFKELAGDLLPGEFPGAEILNNTGVLFKNRSSGELKAISLFDVESLIAPAAILHSRRVGVIVPIRLGFAEKLISDSSRQEALFAAPPLFLEKAYFRSPRQAGVLKRGMIIFFYVSSRGGGSQAIIGFARCTFSDVLAVGQAAMRFKRQGVLGETQLAEMAEAGQIHAFTFDNFNRFICDVSLSALREAEIRATSSLQSIRRVDAEEIRRIVDLGYKNAPRRSTGVSLPGARRENIERAKNSRAKKPAVPPCPEQQALDLFNTTNGPDATGSPDR